MKLMLPRLDSAENCRRLIQNRQRSAENHAMKRTVKQLTLLLGLIWATGCASWREAWEHPDRMPNGTPVTERDLLYRSQEGSLFFWPSQLAPPPGLDDSGPLSLGGGGMSVDWLSRGWHDPRGDGSR